MPAILMVGLLLIISLDSTVGEVGVCNGRLGKKLPPPSKVISLYKQNNIKRMRLYDPHPPTLDALCGSGIELMLGVPDADLPILADCLDNARSWVQGNITSYPDVSFRHIAVGNEIEADSEFAPFVLPAMQNLYDAVCEAGHGNRIRVSTSVKTDLIENSYPPKNGEFKCDTVPYIKPILEFLKETRSPLLVNVYPYFAYMGDKVNINLSYALLEPNSGVNAEGVYYDNLFYAIYYAMDAAVEKLVGVSEGAVERLGDQSSGMDMVASETGWSSKSGSQKLSAGDESPAATVENARKYNNNLMRIVKKGTPRRPGRPIETYIFAMFDENEKPGNEEERHFGIFDPEGKPKYPLRFT
ncbi:hypothetical protein C2S52_012580 [Perilla frutescens var. hirtella]|nr:hypothetical protein C2S52_012580 [Perilla frutescens var. hirtella]